MFEWVGRGKRLEMKLDELLAYYGPRQVAGSAPLPPSIPLRDPIVMTDEREDKIMKDLEDGV